MIKRVNVLGFSFLFFFLPLHPNTPRGTSDGYYGIQSAKGVIICDLYKF